jgi:type II secretory pathway component PulJ
LTLIELVIALGLLALLMLLVIQIFDRALATWRTAETRGR